MTEEESDKRITPNHVYLCLKSEQDNGLFFIRVYQDPAPITINVKEIEGIFISESKLIFSSTDCYISRDKIRGLEEAFSGKYFQRK